MLFKAPSAKVDSNNVLSSSSINALFLVKSLMNWLAALRLIEIKYPPSGTTTSYNVQALTCSPFTAVVAGHGWNAASISKIFF